MTYYTKESKKWLASLQELRLINVELKNKLSEAINRQVSIGFIEKVEYFHQLFIEKDQIIDILRHDINVLVSSKGPLTNKHQLQYNALENDIVQLSNELYQLKASFSDFLVTCKTN